MIFATVGTHEQPFNRLVEYMDKWAQEHGEDVIVQTGFSTYEPKNVTWSKLYPYKKMVELIADARIVITHGGPSSFILPLQMGKIPVVVPRKLEFGEHVNDHQVSFSHAVAERYGNIIVIDNVGELGDILVRYDDIVVGMTKGLTSNNDKFCRNFELIVDKMVE